MKAKAWPYADIKFPFSVDESGSFADYLLERPEDMNELALGSRVLIHDNRDGKKIWMEATVVGIRAVAPFNLERENLLYVHDETLESFSLLKDLNGPHRIQKYLIRVRLNKELEYNNELERFEVFPVQKPPSANSYLTFPSILPKKEQDNEPSLTEMLEIKQNGIRVGAVGFGNYPYEDEGEFLVYHLDLESLDNKHMFIVGESGSGKTVLLKNLALEIRAFDSNSKLILMDVQGDLTQIFLPDLVDAPTSKGWQSKINKHSKLNAIDIMKPFNLVIPATKHNDLNEHIQTLKKLARKRGIQVYEIGLRLRDLNLPSEVEYMFRVTSEQVAMLLDEEVDYLRIHGKEKNINIPDLETLIQYRMNKAKGKKEFTSSAGTVYYTSTGNAALRALKNLKGYFDFHDISMESEDDPLDCLENEGTTIIYLDHLSWDERLMWEMQIVKWLYDNKSNKTNHYYVFIDEAHQIIPAKAPAEGLKGTFDRLRTNFERLAREGRKFGINLILSTQSPNDLHEIVPNQCPTKFVMKIDPKNAQYAQLDKDLASIAARFNQGQFWFRSPFNGTMEWVRIHSWASNLPHEPMVRYWPKLREQAKKE